MSEAAGTKFKLRSVAKSSKISRKSSRIDMRACAPQKFNLKVLICLVMFPIFFARLRVHRKIKERNSLVVHRSLICQVAVPRACSSEFRHNKFMSRLACSLFTNYWSVRWCTTFLSFPSLFSSFFPPFFFFFSFLFLFDQTSPQALVASRSLSLTSTTDMVFSLLNLVLLATIAGIVRRLLRVVSHTS